MRGGDTHGLRAYNERLIIGAIRQVGALSKADIARATGLSAQAASVIVNDLLAERILVKRPKVRGQIGQPQTPIALRPDGAYAVGVKIGRRSVEAVLIDFLGAVVRLERSAHDWPEAASAMGRACAAARAVMAQAPRERIAGLGVAMPGDLHEWAEEMGLAAGALDDWRDVDVARALGQATGLPAVLCNDATAACAAELAVGEAIASRSALYLYLGAFVGGGLVFDGRLHRGAQGNAAAVGSMPMTGLDAQGRPRQLIHEASPVFLERALAAVGIDAAPVVAGAADDPRAEPLFAAWLRPAAAALARAAMTAASVVDVETVVIDGVIRREWLLRVVEAVRVGVGGMNRAGLSPFVIAPGSIGERARVLGAALLPLQERFAPHPDLVLRSGQRAAEPELQPAAPR